MRARAAALARFDMWSTPIGLRDSELAPSASGADGQHCNAMLHTDVNPGRVASDSKMGSVKGISSGEKQSQMGAVLSLAAWYPHLSVLAPQKVLFECSMQTS